MEHARGILFCFRVAGFMAIKGMCEIILQDFADEKKLYMVAFDERWTLLSVSACKKGTLRAQGFCAFEKVGLLRRSKVVIAVFCDGRAVWMSVYGKSYDLTSPTVTARRRNLYLGAREFKLKQGGTTLECFRYWNASTDPSGIGGDIFEYVERITQDMEHKAMFLKILNAMWRDGIKRVGDHISFE